ncbi:MAG: N-acetylneuraminate lyase [Clostridia bacterium]|nr:N-acetylneuraminate lyase [Clostridia bacterium]
MNTNKYAGIYTALLTPFDNNNKINEKALEKLVKYNIDKGVKGFYVCGSTGEAFMLTTDERKYVMEIVKSVAPNHTLIAHIGSIHEDEAAKLAIQAKDLSYDVVSSVTPFYYKFSFEEIKNYYFRLADSADLPMLVYYIPVFSGVSMGINEMKSFLTDDRFIGIKFTSNDFFTLEQAKAAFPDKVVFNGFDEMFLAGLSMGADGGIGSTYNFMADKYIKIQELFKSGKIEEAQQIQKEANRITALLCKIGVMQAEKEVLNQLGFDFGICRHPFGEISSENKEIIAKEIVPYLA